MDNLKLKDCILETIEYDRDGWDGCETCNYGSRYINIVKLKFNDGDYKKIEIRHEYDYLMNESDLMKIICNAIEDTSKQELIDSLITAAKESNRRYSGLDIYINDEEILEAE
jgi:hypothetical protein